MRRHFKIILTVFFLLATNIFVSAGASDTWQGKGRIAFSSDGNFHDHDDIQATKMSMMIIAKEGLQDKLVLYTYADHIWGSDDQLEKMHIVALGSKEKFGFHDANFMAAVENPTAAYNAMAEVIAVSTADNPLFIVAAGPMQVVGEGLRIANETNANALNHITVISHSDWNNNHGQSKKDPETTNHDGWTWDMMKSSFGSKVNFRKISDQNGTPPNVYTSNDKFKASTMASWAWMNTHQDPNVNWVYQNHTGKGSNSAADYSDAGMAFYLLTGDEMGNPVKLKSFIGDDIIAVTPADPLKVSRVNLNESNYHIKTLGDTYQLAASVLPETAENKAVSWSSSNTAVATVDPTGLVTGHQLGSASITVKTVDGSRTATCTFQVGEVAAGDYQSGDDYICFEAEWTKSDLQKWVIRQPEYDDYVHGTSGVAPINNTYLEYTGGDENGNTAGQDILVYKFKPQTDGKYRLTGRMAQNQNGAAWDKCNDIYVKMEGDFTSGNNTPKSILTQWTKLYGRGLEDWGAFVQLDVNHTKYQPVYNLKAGVEYTLSVSGRATRTCVDYYLFYKEGADVQVAEKLDLATHSPEYMRPGTSGPTCMTIKAHDFTNTAVSGYDPAAKGTIPGSPSDGINKGEPVIGCGGANGISRPIAAEVSYDGVAADVFFSVKAVGEPDGECTYEVFVNDTKVGENQSTRIYGTGVAPYTYEDLLINEEPFSIKKGDVIRITSNQVSNNLVPEGDGYATARGRWVSIDICGEGIVVPANESVSFLDLPPAFSTGSLIIPFKVKYTANETRDINVVLKTPEDQFVQNKTITVQQGSGVKELSIELDEAVEPANGYKVNLALRPEGGDWTTNIDSQDVTVNFIDGAVLPTADKVAYVNAPKEFTTDDLTLPVSVTYQATQERDINVEIKDPNDKYITNSKVKVQAGYGETIVSVALASKLSVGKNYKMILSIRPVGGDWTTNIDRKDNPFEIKKVDDNNSGTAVKTVQSEKVILYPNPTTGQISFTNEGDINLVTVLNIQGQMLMQKAAIIGLNTFSISEFSSGMYIVQLRGESSMPIVKEIVKN